MKSKRAGVRNHVAMGMIISGTGRKQVFADKRTKRSKDYKHSWRKEARDETR